MANKKWITIDNPDMSLMILAAIGDDDKKKILNAVIDKPKIISEILKDCSLPQTSGYRKVNNLIEKGLLVIDGYELATDGKPVNRYQSVFQNIQIHIEKNKVIVQVKPTKESFKSKFIL